jgi:hypothetical protein
VVTERMSMLDKLGFDDMDYSVVVKIRSAIRSSKNLIEHRQAPN